VEDVLKVIHNILYFNVVNVYLRALMHLVLYSL
jgi:hypothetical protein